MTPSSVTRAAIYCRISSDPTGRAAGVELQEQDCRQLCADRGWEVAEVFTDNDVSAYSGRPRPAYRALLGAIKGGRVGAVVVWHSDRLHRRLAELEEFVAVVEGSGVKVSTVKGGEIDLSTHSGRMVARILGSVAQHEVEATKTRTRRAALERAKNGLPVAGGWRPFGFEVDHVSQRADEVALIREAVSRTLNGESLKSIVKDWRARGVKSVRGGPFSGTTLRQVLVSPRIAGLRTHHGENHPAVWDPVIDEDTHAAVVALLCAPGRRTNFGPPVSYLLTGGVGVCGKCGHALRAASGAYVCPPSTSGGCGGIKVDQNLLEEFITGVTLEFLSSVRRLDAALEASGENPDIAALTEALSGYRARLEALGTAHLVEGLIDRPEYLRRRSELEARITDTEQALALTVELRFSATVPTGEKVHGWWEGATVEQRRSLLALVFESVTVGPVVKRGSLEGRVTVTPRT